MPIINKEFDVKFLGWNNDCFEQSEWIKLVNTDNTEHCGVNFEVKTPPVTNVVMTPTQSCGSNVRDIHISSETENAAGSDANKTRVYTPLDIFINDFFYSIIDKTSHRPQCIVRIRIKIVSASRNQNQKKKRN